MRIVTWNCNGALRNKTHVLDQLEADVLVIQECEDPSRSTRRYQQWASNYLWTGNNKNKGLGVFAGPDVSLSFLRWTGKQALYLADSESPLLEWNSSQLELFLPCLIDEVPLVAVWTKQAKSFPTMGYIGQAWLYFYQHQNKLADNQIICGDFNSNTQWDAPDKFWGHDGVVSLLSKHGIQSLYHHQNKLSHGDEQKPTFYMHRNFKKPYHIDYFFTAANLLKTSKLAILSCDIWLNYSDHLPLVADIDIYAQASLFDGSVAGFGFRFVIRCWRRL